MGAYIPFLVRLISTVLCDLIAGMGRVKATPIRTLPVVIPGPFAILLVFFYKPEPNINL